MSAARLDPFSARLHAIHQRGAKDRAQPLAPKPESARPTSPLLDMSAPEAATGVIERQRSHSSWDDDAPVYRTWAREAGRALEEQQRMSDRDDDDEPPGAGHFATTVPRDPPGPRVERTHEYEGAYAEQRAAEERWRTDARDDDAREDIRMIRRRLSALENEVQSLKDVLGRLTGSGAGGE